MTEVGTAHIPARSGSVAVGGPPSPERSFLAKIIAQTGK
jgi:hypothetical protein